MAIKQKHLDDITRDISFSSLKIIKNIRFTKREIDTVACLIGGRSYKKIASILSISPKTVEYHVRNIILKIGCNSREGIIDFIEKSDKFALTKTYYANILTKITFEQELKKLSPITKENNISCLIFHYEKQTTKTSFIYQLERSLNIAGIRSFSKTWTKNKSKDFIINKIGTKQINCVIYILSKIFVEQLKVIGHEIHKEAANLIPLVKEGLSPIIFLLSDEEIYLEINKNQPNLTYISLSESGNHYSLFFELLKKILPDDSIDANIIKFKKQYEIFQDHSVLQKSENNDSAENNHDIKRNSNRKKKITYFKWLTPFLLLFIGFSFTPFKIYHKKNNSLGHQLQNVKTKATDNKQNILHKNQQKTVIFNLPPRNRKFIGRSDYLTQIKKQLDKQKLGIITQVISGLGGVGKTQLATEFAYQATEKGEYSLICWISAETADSINHVYKKLAEFLQIDIKGFDSVKIESLVYYKLGQKYKDHRILFVLDNAISHDSVQKYLLELHKQLSSYLVPSVLVTSRSQHWPENSITLDKFTAEEAIAFIKKHLPNEEKNAITKLAKTLHHFPLALNQAAAYIKRHTNIDDYLKLYTNKQKVFLNKFHGDKNQYNESLWKTWNISFNKLSGTAKKMLFMSSYLYPGDIPMAFFDDLSTEKRADAIEELRNHSFIVLINSGKSFKIHRLLQEVIRITLTTNNGGIIRIISNISTRKTLNNTTDLLKSKFDFSYSKFDEWESCDEYLMHAKILAEHLLNSNNSDFYANGIKLYAQVAMYLTYIHKNYTYAQETWGKISSFIKQYFKDEESKLILANINTHIALIMRTKDRVKSKEYAKKSVSLYKTIAKPIKTSAYIDELLPYFRWDRNLISHDGIISDQIFSLLCLGQSVQDNTLSMEDSITDWKIAENYFKEAISILLDKNEIANYLITYKIALFSSLGKLYLLQGSIKNAENILNSAKLLAEKNLPTHIETAYVYERLAGLQYHMGKYNDAIKNLNKCLKIRMYTLSKDHYKIAHIKVALGLTLCASNQIKRGIKSLQEAEAIYDSTLPKGHKHFVLMYLSMSNAFEMNKNYDKALQYLIKTRNILKEYSEHGLYSVMSYRFPITEKFPTLKSIEKDANYYTQALDLTKKLFGENHIRAARYYYLLGQVFENVNDKAKAKQHYQKALSIVNKQYLNDKILTLATENKNNIKIIQKIIWNHLKKIE